jgi:DNA-binding transcriptional ArsR family regulator
MTEDLRTPHAGVGPSPAPASKIDELPELRDPRTMRALAHPVRMDLLEALALEGPLTATEAGALIGQSATTCSFHLRQLAKYGLVEDAGRPGARERPWRLTHVGARIPEATGEAEVDLAADALTTVLLERYIDRMRRASRERRGYSGQWREATGFTEAVLFVTAEEMEEVRRTLEELAFRFADRLANPGGRPEGAVPVELLICAYLMRPDEGSRS